MHWLVEQYWYPQTTHSKYDERKIYVSRYCHIAESIIYLTSISSWDVINGIYIQQKVQKLKPITKYERIDESGENRIFEAFANRQIQGQYHTKVSTLLSFSSSFFSFYYLWCPWWMSQRGRNRGITIERYFPHRRAHISYSIMKSFGSRVFCSFDFIYSLFIIVDVVLFSILILCHCSYSCCFYCNRAIDSAIR